MPESPARCIAVMGATATGKSALGVRLARRLGGEVVSMDSCQVYRGMDIGTGKITPAETVGVRHHLLDILDPDESGSAGRHAELAREAVADIAGRGLVPVLVGGTGLYFDAFLHPFIDPGVPSQQFDAIRSGFEGRDTGELYAELAGVDPARAEKLSANDRVRITRALELYLATGVPMSELLAEQRAQEAPGDGLELVLTMPREKLRDRIARRTRALYEAGWVEEVRRLEAAGYGPSSPGMRSLGYEEIGAALGAGDDPADTAGTVITRTQQYAKRQETYFRRFSEAVWLDVSDPDFNERALMLSEVFLGRPE